MTRPKFTVRKEWLTIRQRKVKLSERLIEDYSRLRPDFIGIMAENIEMNRNMMNFIGSELWRSMFEPIDKPCLNVVKPEVPAWIITHERKCKMKYTKP